MKPDSLASIMNWSKNLYVFMLGALIVFSGCFGTGSTDGDETDTPQPSPDWVNERGTTGVWNISLADNQWLEVKSAAAMISYPNSTNEDRMTGIDVMEDEHWGLSSGGFSTIFGGNYSTCIIYDDGNCWNQDPDDDWVVREWSIIYRIHDV